jgi:signal transduction histidine kinase
VPPNPKCPRCCVGDPGRLRQVLVNLAGNAVKFTHLREVAVRVALTEEAADSVLLRFTVRDTGIGIPADKRTILFEKFSQVDASTTRRYGGTGLGLAIAKELVELMDGQIGAGKPGGAGHHFLVHCATAETGRRRPSGGTAAGRSARGAGADRGRQRDQP